MDALDVREFFLFSNTAFTAVLDYDEETEQLIEQFRKEVEARRRAQRTILMQAALRQLQMDRASALEMVIPWIQEARDGKFGAGFLVLTSTGQNDIQPEIIRLLDCSPEQMWAQALIESGILPYLTMDDGRQLFFSNLSHSNTSPRILALSDPLRWEKNTFFTDKWQPQLLEMPLSPTEEELRSLFLQVKSDISAANLVRLFGENAVFEPFDQFALHSQSDDQLLSAKLIYLSDGVWAVVVRYSEARFEWQRCVAISATPDVLITLDLAYASHQILTEVREPTSDELAMLRKEDLIDLE